MFRKHGMWPTADRSGAGRGGFSRLAAETEMGVPFTLQVAVDGSDAVTRAGQGRLKNGTAQQRCSNSKAGGRILLPALLILFVDAPAWSQTKPVVTVAAVSSPVTEGANAEFTVTRTGSTAATLTVVGVATETGAMTTFSGSTRPTSMTIAAGSASFTLAVATLDDALDEVDSVITFALRAGDGYTRGSASTAMVTVTDNDPGICSRTPEVRDALAKAVSKAKCGAVTAADLAGITSLNLAEKLFSGSSPSLQAGDFAGLTALTTLDLYGNRLTSLPPGVFDDLTALTSLRLSGNRLTSLPPGVFDDLTALRKLRLFNNDMSSLPPGVFDDLTALTELGLGGNSLSSLPPGVFDDLTALRKLWLFRNDMSSLPPGVFDDLTALTELDLYDNSSLTSLPPGVFDDLTALTSLGLSGNNMSSLPPGVFDDLTALTSLRLSGNSLSSLPPGVFDDLTALTSLDLQDNRLTSLPPGLFNGLTALRSLWLGYNSLSSLPPGVFDDLTALTTLDLQDNRLTSLPPGLFNGLTALGELDLTRNPGAPFALTVGLERTDGAPHAGSPATVKVTVREGAPESLEVPLSVTGATAPASASVGAGGLASSTFTVTQSTDGQPAQVNVGTLPSPNRGGCWGWRPPCFRGISYAAADDLPLTLFGSETPRVAITGVPSAINSTTALSVTFTWSEDVTGFETGDVTVTGGTKGTFAATDAKTYTLTVTPTSGSNVVVTVANDVATDGVNTGPAAAVTETAAWDAAAPTVAITGVPARINSASDFFVTFTWSEDVTGFETGDVTVTGGTKGTFAATDAKTYTLVVTPSGNADVVVTVVANAATDGVNTGPAAAVTETAAWDVAAPTMAITGVPSAVNSTTALSVTFTWSEDVTGFETHDVTVTGGAKGTFAATSAKEYTLVVTPSGNADVVVTVVANAATDGANTGPAAAVTETAAWDVAAPTMAITGVPAKINAKSDLTVTFTWSEDVTEFETGDVTVTGGTKGTFTATSAREYTLAVTPSGNADVVVTVANDAATDGVNTGPAAAVTETAAWDAAAPTVAITGVPAKIDSATALTVTFTWSEDVTEFETGDVTVTGGTKGTFKATSAREYTLAVTPSGSADVVVTVGANAATDGVNTGPAAAVTETAAWDAAAPKVGISGVPSKINATTALNVTFTWSEDVTGFETGDVTVTGGTKGTFAATDARTYTLLVTPTSGAGVVVTVANDAATDGVNTGPAAAVTETAAWDAAAPKVGISGVPSKINAKTALSVTFTWSEDVTEFETGDVTVTGGTKGTVTATSDREYSLAVTPTGSADVVVTVAANSVTDGLQTGPAATVEATAAWDAAAPKVAITGVPPRIDSATARTVTFTWSEDVTDFAAGDVTVTGGTKGTFTATSAREYTLAVTPSGNADVVVTVANDAATDGVNTGPAAAVTETAAWDAAAPAVAITGVPARINATSDLTVTFTWSEDVTGFETGDVTVTGGTKGTFAATDARTYTLLVTPTSGAGVVVTVAANSATDGLQTGPATAVTETAAWDAAAPTLSTAAVDGATLTLTYNEALDEASKPASSAFTVNVGGTEVSLAASGAVSITGSAVTLTLASAVAYGDMVTMSYMAPLANPVQDIAGNDAGYLTDRAVTNSTPFTGICGRTRQLQNSILRTVSKTDCQAVTLADLAGITLWLLPGLGIESLRTGDFAGLTGLTSLWLIGNDISSLPPGVFDDLPRLRTLDLSDNNLSSWPLGVFDDLTALRTLRLGGNSLSSLPPDAFDDLTRLNSLNLSDNNLSSLPPDVFDDLTWLSSLYLSDNNLSSLPPDVFDDLTWLSHLNLSDNNLSSLPPDVFDDLTWLTRLDLDGNNLSSLPPDVFDGLTRLHYLYLQNTGLSSLPPGVFNGLTVLGELDLTGNPGAPFALTVGLERTDGAPHAGSPATVKVTVREGAPESLEVPLSVTGATAPASASVGAGGLASSTFTVTQSTDGQPAQVNVGTLPSPSVAGCPRSESPCFRGISYAAADDLPLTLFDSETPTVGITGVPARINATSDLTVTFTWSEDVTGFETGDVTVTGGTKGTFAVTDARTYTLVVTPASGSSVVVTVANDAATDGVNTGPAAAVTATATWDATAPTVGISGVPSKINATTALDVTFTWSEDVTGFETGDVTVTGGTKGAFTATSAKKYTLVVTPSGNADVVVTVANVAATDGVNTGPAAAETETATWDATAPTVGISGVPSKINATTALDVTFTWSEDVTDFAAGDVTVTGGTKGTFTATSGKEYTLAVTPSGNADVVVTVANVAATDGVNTGPAAAETATATWDATAPTVGIGGVPSKINATTAFTVTFTFSEDVTGFETGDVTVTGGAKGTLEATSATEYTLIVTPTASADVVVTVANDAATDGANTGPASAVTATATWDATAPTVGISGVPSKINATTALDVTFTWSEDVTGFETGDVTVTGGTKGTFAATDARTYTLLVTPSGNADVVVTVANVAATDGVNTGPAAAETATATWDATAPTVGISGVPSKINARTALDVTFTWSEDVTDFAAGDVTVTGGTKGTFTATSGKEYTLAVTPSGNADVVVTVANVAATDGVNTGPAAAVTETATWDATAPTVGISGVPSKINATTALSVTFTWSEDVTDFAAGDVTVTGGTKGTFVATDAGTYTLLVTPMSGAGVVVTVANDAATDGVNTGPAAAVTETATWDAAAPTVAITGVPAKINATSDRTVTFTWSEDVTGFATGDVTVTGGTKGTFAATDARTYTLLVTPTSGAGVVVTVANDAATDGVNTGPAAAVTETAAWDAAAPTVAITGVPAKINATTALSVTFRWSEDVTDFAAGDVTVTGGTKGTFAATDARTYTLLVTPTSGAGVVVTVANDAATDGVNTGPAAAVTETATWDAAAPTVAITGVPARINSTSDRTVTFTWSEDVTDFAAGDVTVTGGTTGTFAATDARTYTLAVTPTSGASVVVTVAANSATDGVNTGPAATETATATWDAAAPTVAITRVPGKINSTAAFTATFTWSEDVRGFATGDVTVTGGTTGTFAATDARTYTLAVTPTSGASVVVTVANDAATDGVNTGPAATETAKATWDATAPTVAITGVPAKINSTTAFTATFTWSEDVREFAAGDVAVTGGTTGTFAATDARTYTLAVMPTSGSDVVVAVRANAASDGANAGPAEAETAKAAWATAPTASGISKTVDEDTTLTFAASDFTGAFSDADGHTLKSVKVVTLPDAEHGKLKVGTTDATTSQVVLAGSLGTLKFEPAADWNGKASFTYKVTDSDDDESADAATVSITVSAVDDKPTASDISKTVNEDTTLTFAAADFTGAFSDPDGHTLKSVKIVTLPTAAHGTLKAGDPLAAVSAGASITAANLGTLKFEPAADWNGKASFTYKVTDSDDEESADAATVSITVSAVDDAPTASDISKTVNEDTTLTFAASDFTGAFSDPDGHTLKSVKIVTLPDGGHGTLKAGNPLAAVSAGASVAAANLGTLTFEPAADWNGSASYTYKVTDSDDEESVATATVSITVSAVDDAPTASDISKTVNEDTTLTFAASDFTGAFSDPDGHTLKSVKIVTLPTAAHGTLKVGTADASAGQSVLAASLGTITFEPAADWNGKASFTYKVTDSDDEESVAAATVTITVSAVDDLPTASDISKSTAESTTLTFAANDFTGAFSDADGHALKSVKIVTLPAGTGGTLKVGTAAASANQTVVAASLGTITFVPVANWNGTASFTYKVTDSSDAESAAAATVTIAVGERPTGSDIGKSVAEDTTLTFAASDFTGAFSDPNGHTLKSVKIVTLPDATHGTLRAGDPLAAVIAGASVAAADLGTLVFEPVADWNGKASFTYKVTDSDDKESAAAGTVTITVSAVDDLPTASDIRKSTAEDTTLMFAASDFTGAFSDPDGHTLKSVKIVTLPTATHGTLKAGNPLTVVSAGDSITAANLGTLTFEPAADWNGSASYTYKVTDSDDEESVATATVSITVSAVDDAPTASDISKTVNEDTTLTFAASDFTGAFSDPDGHTLKSVKIVTLPTAAHGTLKVGTADASAGQSVLAASLGTITFEPAADWNGKASFTYKVTDSADEESVAAATVTITVSAVDDLPAASDISKSTAESTTLTFAANDFTGAFSDADGHALKSVKIVTLPAGTGGTLKVGTAAASANQTVVAASLGTITFVPVANWNGTASFTYKVTDSSDAESAAAATVTIAVGERPTGSDISKSTAEDTTLTFAASDFTGAFSDPNGHTLKSVKIVTLPAAAHGTLKAGNPLAAVSAGASVAAANLGTLTFEPAADWNGSASFTYKVTDSDDEESADAATVSITVSAVDDAPTASDISKTVNEDTTLTFAASDFTGAFSDADGHTLKSVKIVTLPTATHGTLKAGNPLTAVSAGDSITAANLGTLTFEPAADWNGSASYTYKVTDSDDEESVATATVSITVSAVDDAPTASDISKTVNEDTTLTFAASDFTGAFSDPDGHTLKSVKIVTLPTAAHGTLKVGTADASAGQSVLAASLGTITFEPAADWNGKASFTYKVTDSDDEESVAAATVTITVSAVDDLPAASDISKSTAESTTLTFAANDFTGAFSDADGHALKSVKIVTLPAGTGGTLKVGTAAASANQTVVAASLGTITFVPVANWNGTASFTYKVTDSSDAESAAAATVTIAVGERPTGSNIGKSVAEDTTLMFAASDFTGAFSDPNGHTLKSVKIVTLPDATHGTLRAGDPLAAVIAGASVAAADLGTLVFEPVADWNGKASFTYKVTDSDDKESAAAGTVTITVVGSHVILLFFRTVIWTPYYSAPGCRWPRARSPVGGAEGSSGDCLRKPRTAGCLRESSCSTRVSLTGEFWNTARSMSVKLCSTMAPQMSSRKYTK